MSNLKPLNYEQVQNRLSASLRNLDRLIKNTPKHFRLRLLKQLWNNEFLEIKKSVDILLNNKYYTPEQISYFIQDNYFHLGMLDIIKQKIDELTSQMNFGMKRLGIEDIRQFYYNTGDEEIDHKLIAKNIHDRLQFYYDQMVQLISSKEQKEYLTDISNEYMDIIKTLKLLKKKLENENLNNKSDIQRYKHEVKLRKLKIDIEIHETVISILKYAISDPESRLKEKLLHNFGNNHNPTIKRTTSVYRGLDEPPPPILESVIADGLNPEISKEVLPIMKHIQQQIRNIQQSNMKNRYSSNDLLIQKNKQILKLIKKYMNDAEFDMAANYTLFNLLGIILDKYIQQYHELTGHSPDERVWRFGNDKIKNIENQIENLKKEIKQSKNERHKHQLQALMLKLMAEKAKLSMKHIN